MSSELMACVGVPEDCWLEGCWQGGCWQKGCWQDGEACDRTAGDPSLSTGGWHRWLVLLVPWAAGFR